MHGVKLRTVKRRDEKTAWLEKKSKEGREKKRERNDEHNEVPDGASRKEESEALEGASYVFGVGVTYHDGNHYGD